MFISPFWIEQKNVKEANISGFYGAVALRRYPSPYIYIELLLDCRKYFEVDYCVDDETV